MKNRTAKGAGRDGFTLIELLVVSVVIAFLVGLVFPSLNRAKEAGRSAFCKNNMRQIALGMLLYADDNNDYLPWPGEINQIRLPDWVIGGYRPIDMTDPRELSQMDYALHAESGSIFTYVTGFPRVWPYTKTFTNAFPVYRCPSTGDWGRARRVCYSMNGWFNPQNLPSNPKGIQHNAIEGASQKVLLVDESPATSESASYEPASGSTKGRLTLHNSRANLAFVDGHCESMRHKKLVEIESEKDNSLRAYFDPTYP